MATKREVASCKISRSKKRLLQALAEQEGRNVNQVLKTMIETRLHEVYGVGVVPD